MWGSATAGKRHPQEWQYLYVFWSARGGQWYAHGPTSSAEPVILKDGSRSHMLNAFGQEKWELVLGDIGEGLYVFKRPKP